MKLKRLSHLLVFCFGVMLLFRLVGRGLYLLTITIFSEQSTYLTSLVGIKNFIVAFIGILILKMLGKINILKDKGKGFWRGVLTGSIPLVFLAFVIFISIMCGAHAPADIRFKSLEVIMPMIFQCLSVGVVEEIYFRGILFNVINDYFGNKNACDVWKTVVLSGFLFGIYHLNIFEGMSGFVSRLILSIVCIGIGIFFGAVYMRCRNIYSLMFVHALHDIFPNWMKFIVNNNSFEFGLSQDFIFTIILLIVCTPVAMFLLRKKKMSEIINSEPNKLSLDSKCS